MLKRRLEKLEQRKIQLLKATIIIAKTQPGETKDEAVEREKIMQGFEPNGGPVLILSISTKEAA